MAIKKSYLLVRRFFQPSFNIVNVSNHVIDYEEYVGIQDKTTPYHTPITLTQDTQLKRTGSSLTSSECQNYITEPYHSLTGKKISVNIESVPKPIKSLNDYHVLPKMNNIWCYHDEKQHQVLAHLSSKDAFKNTNRDNHYRNSLDTWIHPKDTSITTNMHLIPFGYHGTESDPRLIIGWDKKQFVGQIKAFQKKGVHHQGDIIWHIDVRRSKTGVAMRQTIYNALSNDVIYRETFNLHNTPFYWKG
ncbi:hypothetical protein MTQ93_09735 [Staphylococcus agnetis]|uniref:hypothetical protein n=1 Tax=Staphylococcus agnetis TaxID=985762 RepID=UPI00208E2ADB|nr:hypothetical protein [Staphylococcus agnetis]MCO4346325.1 hypothetical protein [Staphylococcus agnetis]MCO4360599.1 hypothetical protein [Staphylococcus agnetis]